MLEILLTSKARVRILSYILFNGEHHLRKIARETGVSPIQASNELKNLQKAGIVSLRCMANLTLYKANEACPFIDELRRIFVKTEYIAESLGESLREAEFALIYGSLAKGDFSEHSDIDLLVIGNIDRKAFESDIDKAEQTIQREINYVIWRKSQLRKKAGNGFLRSIISGPVIMLIGEEKDARKAMGGDPQGSGTHQQDHASRKTGSSSSRRDH